MEGEPGYEIVEKSEAMRDLFRFGQSLGIKLNPNVTYPVFFPPGYPGVLALEHLEPNDTILTAPNSSMLHIKLANSEPLKKIYSKYLEDFAEGNGGENNRFIVYLLSELSKGKSSKWYPYLSTLPENIEQLSDWNAQELQELQDDALMQYSLGKHSQDMECNESLKNILQNYPSIIAPEYLDKINWAWRVICTRAYGRCLPQLSLIPIADLFNHQNVMTNYFYAKENELDDGVFDLGDDDHDDPMPYKVFTISAGKLGKLAVGNKKTDKAGLLMEKAKEEDRKIFVKKFKAALRGRNEVQEAPDCMFKIMCSENGILKGNQVCIQYGRYSNRQLLFQYGFAMKDNKYDYCILRIPVSEVYEDKGIEPPASEEPEYFEFKLKSDRLNSELLSFIRYIVWDYNTDPVLSFFEVGNLQLDLKVYERYIFLLENELKNFATSEEEDLELLTKQIHYRLFFAVIYK
ncbi:hypothetical protein SteCoe_31595 [Stentor coeruleus]|uniref:SET domain-containing protein n=1 Tax=Stentor coeruleus TaxID=5963 RepID=A0A1R2B0W9_9CILI|nr:hypothetical protein SteCoe_31595 [Stentor coeruleus]